MTNADRIRSMSDETLAEFLWGVSEECEKITICDEECDKCANDDEMCIEGIRAWLKG